MSISMKSILAAAVASLVVGNAMAADGTINFKGEITAPLAASLVVPAPPLAVLRATRPST